MKPTELAIALAAFADDPLRNDWRCADEIRGRLKLLGFDVKTGQVAAWLGRMSRIDAPWIERRRVWGYFEYRLTHFGRNDIENRFRLRLPR